MSNTASSNCLPASDHLPSLLSHTAISVAIRHDPELLSRYSSLFISRSKYCTNGGCPQHRTSPSCTFIVIPATSPGGYPLRRQHIFGHLFLTLTTQQCTCTGPASAELVLRYLWRSLQKEFGCHEERPRKIPGRTATVVGFPNFATESGFAGYALCALSITRAALGQCILCPPCSRQVLPGRFSGGPARVFRNSPDWH